MIRGVQKYFKVCNIVKYCDEYILFKKVKILLIVRENLEFWRFGGSCVGSLYWSVVLEHFNSVDGINFISGGDEWKLLAEKLGMSYDEIRVLDKRTLNPCDVALNLVANSRHVNVGEVYDILVECELAGSADLL